MKRLIYILLFFSMSVNAQIINSYAYPTTPTEIELYPTGNAASKGVAEVNSISGWYLNGGLVTVNSLTVTDDGFTGDYVLQFISGDGLLDSWKINLAEPLVTGDDYEIEIYIRSNGASDARIYFDNLAYTLATDTGVSATHYFTNTWTKFTITRTATATAGVIRVYPAYFGVTNDAAEIGYISIIKL